MISSDEVGCFGDMVNALFGGKSKTHGHHRPLFPKDDALDLQNGAYRIPYEVTDARRAGKTVTFVQVGTDPQHWYWNIQGRTPVMHPI